MTSPSNEPAKIFDFYLASPYTHPEREVREKRARMAAIKCAELIRAGFDVYAPIPQGHLLASHGDVSGDWEAWERFDKKMILHSKALAVYLLEGCDLSVGVRAEIEWAEANGIPVVLIEV